jgi:tRNA uridine 5-carboxymethylaminomethyl modification enzyme
MNTRPESCSTWNNPERAHDLIVIGGGHAGIEAALAASRMGLDCLLITMGLNKIGQMSCNPAIGGLGKGHLVREIDALGGEMARAIDSTGLQFRMLNRSKGRAVWSPRAQADKQDYASHMLEAVSRATGLALKEAMVKDVELDGGIVSHVLLDDGSRVRGRAFVLCAGTFLNGVLHHGERQSAGGRVGEEAATGLSEALERLGVKRLRYKTGTPPRLDADSIDFASLEKQPGDDKPQPFRFYENLIRGEQLPCYITSTDERVHDLLRQNLHRAPMFSGQIESSGPRYCPSVEDKVVRFADKDRHQIFLEPEGRNTNEVYVNGFSTSMPEEIQREALQLIPGLERARILRPGYAIEYDYFPAWQLDVKLQVQGLPNLFFAGQINGTSGYEEAGIQGLIAAVNAAAYLDNTIDPLVLQRDQAYAGVLVDDLVNRPGDEPYRMFTSRSEFRLLLRQDNADERLMPVARKLGLLEEWRWERLIERRALKQRLTEWLHNTPIGMNGPGASSAQRQRGAEWLRRPEVELSQVLESCPEAWHAELDDDVKAAVEMDIKYAGYIERQQRAVENFRRNENMSIPEDLDYSSMGSLSIEARQRFSQVRPRSLGQASRVSGVRHADLQALWVQLQKRRAAERKGEDVPRGT